MPDTRLRRKPQNGNAREIGCRTHLHQHLKVERFQRGGRGRDAAAPIVPRRVKHKDALQRAAVRKQRGGDVRVVELQSKLDRAGLRGKLENAILVVRGRGREKREGTGMGKCA